MKNTIFASSLLAFALLSLAACHKDTATENELITTIVVHLTNGAGFDQEFEWRDLDGAGGANPSIDTIVVPANTLFGCHLHILDESKNPEVDVAAEVEKESAAHLMVFSPESLNLTVNYADTDANGAPLGIETNWSTGVASTGTITLRLYHEPSDKTNLTTPGGSVDAEVTFPVRIE